MGRQTDPYMPLPIYHNIVIVLSLSKDQIEWINLAHHFSRLIYSVEATYLYVYVGESYAADGTRRIRMQ